MYIARLICSDEDCAEDVLAEAHTLDELETLACDCDCGCGLAVIGWPDHADEPAADVVVVPLGRRPPPADLAA
ncbi:MAG: hypothetical protein ACR2H2_12285 [Solirubrobacteraceae bacterium]